MTATMIIAEAGVNHNGSIEIARQLINVAAEAGADFVKFQTFKVEALVTHTADKAEYQKELTGKNETQFDMIQKLELGGSVHEELILNCQQKGIQFLSSAFDHESIELLRQLNIPLYKIPSGEITNLPYLRHIGRIGKPVIMSTGMATLEEVRAALKILMESGAQKENIAVLHCNTEYPTPKEDVNLKAMLTMRDELGVTVGYSDHTLGIEIPIAAVAMGAAIIEKHLTLDRTMLGPDHRASLEPDEFRAMVQAIRNVEMAIGDGVKIPSPSEARNIPVVRKSIIAKKLIQKGEKFSEENLTTKRPGTGISPMEWDNILKKTAEKDYRPDELIE